MNKASLFASLFASVALATSSLAGASQDFSSNQLGKHRLALKIAELEDKVDSLNNIQIMDVDCDDEPSALQNAIDEAPSVGLEILVSGACAPVFINKSNISIEGVGDAKILRNETMTTPTVTLFGAVNTTLRNITIDNQNIPGLALFAEKSDLAVFDLSGIGNSTAVFVDNSNITVFDNMTFDSLIINALGSTLDGKGVSHIASLGYIGATNSTLFLNDSMEASFFQLTLGAVADITAGSLALNGDLTVDSNAVITIDNSEIHGAINLSTNATMFALPNLVINDESAVAVSTYATLNWFLPDDVVQTVSCSFGGLAYVNGDPNLDICNP